MSRKNKGLWAFMSQNNHRVPTTTETWNAAWEGAQKHYHTKRIQELEQQLSTLQEENKVLRDIISSEIAHNMNTNRDHRAMNIRRKLKALEDGDE